MGNRRLDEAMIKHAVPVALPLAFIAFGACYFGVMMEQQGVLPGWAEFTYRMGVFVVSLGLLVAIGTPLATWRQDLRLRRSKQVWPISGERTRQGGRIFRLMGRALSLLLGIVLMIAVIAALSLIILMNGPQSSNTFNAVADALSAS